jgi:hypothetical protein
MKHKFPVLIRPLGRITGAIEVDVENGSKDANAAPKPAIFPFVSFVIGKGGRVVVGLGVELTNADHDFGGTRCVGVLGDVGAVEEVGVGNLGDMSILGRAGMILPFGDVGVVVEGVWT